MKLTFQMIIGVIVAALSTHNYAANTPADCDIDKALQLFNQVNPPLPQIKNTLNKCDQIAANNVNVLLLHGLLARKNGQADNNYEEAIHWFQKAVAVASPDNHAPALELAVTYEWSKQYDKANEIYKQLLLKNPNLRPALMGSAYAGIAQNNLPYAATIFQKMLQQNPNDVDALNGLGRISLTQGKIQDAKIHFKKALQLNPNNKDALIGLTQANHAVVIEKKNTGSKTGLKQAKITAVTLPPSKCHVDEGLKLVNEKKPPINQISTILARCDREIPNDVNVLLLHGLLARKEGMKIHNYTMAIYWLQKAAAVAKPDNDGPELELATTYEWASLPEKANAIYYHVLEKDPHNRAALLGIASVARAQYHFGKAMEIYNQFLQKNPHDVDALVGSGSVYLANYQFKLACKYYKTAQSIQPNNADIISGLNMLRDVTRYRMTIFQGIYNQMEKSYSTGVNFVANLNATDQLQLLLVHNSREIQFGFFNNPAFLPKNSALIGFHRQYPERYGWGGYVDYRKHVNQGTEYHLEVDGNVYLDPKVQLFGGIEESLPTPFNYQVYWAGATAFTNLPVNFTLTGYWGIQELPSQQIVHSPAYVLDFSKELPSTLYYDVGIGYLPTENNKWTAHANVTLPTFRHQALEAWYEYYWFNHSYYGGLGWRFYW